MAIVNESGPAAVAVEALNSLGCGFDLAADFRLKYRKQLLVERLKTQGKDLAIPGCFTVPNVPRDVKCDTGERIRFTSEVMQFQQMSQWFNNNASVEGKIPFGYFNAMFDLSGSWHNDASQIKTLAFDGIFITLYKLHLARSNLALREDIKNDIPSTWDPQGLARFIQKYGTHIIVAVNVGGQDVLYLKENQSSSLQPNDVYKYLKDAGDISFGAATSQPNKGMTQSTLSHVPSVNSVKMLVTNKDLTIISRRRGGDVFSKTHYEWLQTVDSSPDVISMSFIPITTLISGISGSGFLQHAINLYLRYKPPPEEIRYFLDFQVPRQWIPVYSDLPLSLSRKQAYSDSLRFRFMGPKLYVNTSQVVASRKPVTGVRLYLEGRACNRIAVHLQHLSVLPNSLEQFWIENECSIWNGSNDASKDWFDPVQWKSFSHVCTKPVKYNPAWVDKKDSVFVVTGAQLQVKSHGLKNILHLQLLFTKLVGCSIQTSKWEQPPSQEKTSLLTTISTTFSLTTKTATKTGKKESPLVIDSAVFPAGPPKPVQKPRLLKFVDTAELTKGPQDAPGHWIVIGAQLEVDKGKISLRVKYSLLNYHL